MTIRPISIEGFIPPASPHEAGSAPILQWIEIERLVVDEAYQRPIMRQGRANIREIAANFTWAYFAPVIVAPVEGGAYAIVDGQHRTTAALLAGIKAVPCQVVIAQRTEQAAAFKAINAATTKVSSLALHAASLAAGDPAALILADVCARAEVTLLKYPVQREQQKPGETMSVGTVATCLAQYGRDTLITALQCITRTENNQPGVITGPVVRALCAVLDARKDWRDSGAVLLQAFDEIDILTLYEEAGPIAASRRKATRGTVLIDLFTQELARSRYLVRGAA